MPTPSFRGLALRVYYTPCTSPASFYWGLLCEVSTPSSLRVQGDGGGGEKEGEEGRFRGDFPLDSKSTYFIHLEDIMCTETSYTPCRMWISFFR